MNFQIDVFIQLPCIHFLCFFSSSAVFTYNEHHISPTGGCRTKSMFSVPTDTAIVGHFKLTCDQKCTKNTIHDLSLQKYKEKVANRVKKVLNALHLL